MMSTTPFHRTCRYHLTGHPWRRRDLGKVVVLLMPLLAGCAGAGTQPAAVADDADPLPSIAQPFDGWYHGRQIPTIETHNCGGTGKNMWFRVKDGTIRVSSSRHRRSAVQKPLLEGTVTQNGAVRLYEPNLGRSASGMITGDVLAASDLPETIGMPTHHHSCSYRYEAKREPQR